MPQSALLSISPIDGRYADKTDELRPFFSEYALIYYRLKVEVLWFISLAQNPLIAEVPALSDNLKQRLLDIIENFSPQKAEQVKRIESSTNHDVKAVEYYIKQQIDAIDELREHKEFIHFACTSEDINNLAYALMIKAARDECIIKHIEQLILAFKQLSKDTQDIPMLSRTHGQSASPTCVGKEIHNFKIRLSRQLKALRKTPILGKINGAVGNFNAHHAAYPEVDWLQHSRQFVNDTLDLTWNAHTTQIEPHDYIAEICHNMIRINTILTDFSQDMWGYISLGYFKQKLIADEVGSSTMPHKVNPIDFENAEGNLGLANAVFQHMAITLPTSRWQRDLTDSTLLRNIGVGFAHSTIAYYALLKGFSKIHADESRILTDLNQHWEVLTEAIQTVMRRYGVQDAYEQLKQLSRGQTINQSILSAFIHQLNLEPNVKQHLLALTPESYIGLAKEIHASDE